MMNRRFGVLLLGALTLANFALAQTTTTNQLLGQDGDRRVINPAVPFLMIAPDSRAAGMGDVGVATSPDANSLFWNTAKLAFVEDDMGVAGSWNPWLRNIVPDMDLFYGATYYKLDQRQVIGFGFRYFNLGSIQFTDGFGNNLQVVNPREWAIDANYARQLSPKLSIGGGMRFVVSNLNQGVSSTGVTNDVNAGLGLSGDVGLYYKTPLDAAGYEANLALGAFISNIGSKISYLSEAQGNFQPGNLRIGGAYTVNLDLYNTLTIATDLNKLLVPSPPIYERDENGNLVADSDGNPLILDGQDPTRPLISGIFGSFADAPDGFSEELKEITISSGLEYWYDNTFAARAGYFYEHQDKGNRNYMTFGLGARYQQFGIDFSYLVALGQNNPLAETLRFTVMFEAINPNLRQ